MRGQGRYWPDWDRVRIDVLDELGRADEAQAMRWHQFESVLHAEYLKDYLKRLPDFDDEEAEQRAMSLAAAYPDFDRGLQFLATSPALAAAAAMVLARHREMSGDHYWYLTDAADHLDKEHPLAATLILRAMIGFALDRGGRSATPMPPAICRPAAISRAGSRTGRAIRITMAMSPISERNTAARAGSGMRSEVWPRRAVARGGSVSLPHQLAAETF